MYLRLSKRIKRQSKKRKKVNRIDIEKVAELLYSPLESDNEVGFFLIEGVEDTSLLIEMSKKFIGFNINFFKASQIIQEKLSRSKS